MFAKIYFIIFVLCIFLSSCSGPINFPYHVGTCLKEKDKRYIASKEKINAIYKITELNRSHVEIATYHNFGWYVDKKNHNYFDEGKYFAYAITDCPDGSKNEIKGLYDRIKSIEIN